MYAFNNNFFTTFSINCSQAIYHLRHPTSLFIQVIGSHSIRRGRKNSSIFRIDTEKITHHVGTKHPRKKVLISQMSCNQRFARERASGYDYYR